MRLRLLIYLFIYGFSFLPVVSQDLKTINIEEIPQRKIRKYIVTRSIDEMKDFSSIHASWTKGIDESDFNITKKSFYLRYKLSNVWDSYRKADPVKMWHGHSVRFGLMISKYSNTVIYSNNSIFPEIDTGQVYFLNLKLLRGLFNVPVAFEIIKIDKKKQLLEFSYIDNNKSLGKQVIQFFDDGDGCTRIIHTSYFKSGSVFRDKLLYPYFHKKFVKEYHRDMRQIIKKENTVVAVL